MVFAPVGRTVVRAAAGNSSHLIAGSETRSVMSWVLPDDSSSLAQEPNA